MLGRLQSKRKGQRSRSRDVQPGLIEDHEIQPAVIEDHEIPRKRTPSAFAPFAGTEKILAGSFLGFSFDLITLHGFFGSCP